MQASSLSTPRGLLPPVDASFANDVVHRCAACALCTSAAANALTDDADNPGEAAPGARRLAGDAEHDGLRERG